MPAAILAGVSPAGGSYPVATAAITGYRAGDQTAESPDCEFGAAPTVHRVSKNDPGLKQVLEILHFSVAE
jgi:hypothetical protein